MIKKCMLCGKEFKGRKERKYCSKVCADKARTNIKITERVIKKCEECGKEFEILKSQLTNSKCKRFCSKRCSALWRNRIYGANKAGDTARKKLSILLSERWKDDDFRKKKIDYMIKDNPVYKKGVIEKAIQTRLKNGGYPNNYKYGNGKISKYEKSVMDFLQSKNFYYNYAVPTKIARHAFPNEKFANSYKPDFVNLEHKICIEIDGDSHNDKIIKQLDAKKDRCLTFLGFTIYRFTHKQIDTGEFYKEVNDIWQSL